MICLFLAAGYATRLYPLTQQFPKPLLPVGGKPILDWLLEDIDAIGTVSTYAVVTNHKFADTFTAWAANKPQRITIVDDGTETNDTRLGAVQDMRFAVERLSVDEDLLVVAGDNVLDFSLSAFIAYAQNQKASCVMRYYEPSVEKRTHCGVLTVAADDRITAMSEKPSVPASPWCCPPFYYFVRRDVHRLAEGIAAGCGTDAPGAFVAWLCRQTPVYAMPMPGNRYDIGDKESYQAVQRTFSGIRGEYKDRSVQYE